MAIIFFLPSLPLPTSSSSSLLHIFLPSLPPSLPPSHPPSIPPSLPPSFPPSLPPSVPLSIPPSLSLPPSLPPSQLKLYSQTELVSTSANPLRISDLYLAVAASQEEIEADEFQGQFVRVWIHFVFVLFPIATVIIIYTCDPIQLLLGDKTWQKLRDETNHPRLAAIIQISIVFTMYVFVVDCFAFFFTLKSGIYSNPSHSAFYLTTLTGIYVDVTMHVHVCVHIPILRDTTQLQHTYILNFKP